MDKHRAQLELFLIEQIILETLPIILSTWVFYFRSLLIVNHSSVNSVTSSNWYSSITNYGTSFKLLSPKQI